MVSIFFVMTSHYFVGPLVPMFWTSAAAVSGHGFEARVDAQSLDFFSCLSIIISKGRPEF